MLAALVRESTDDGRLLVRLMCRIARGGKFKTSLTANGKVRELLVRPSISDRIEAVKWLSDRGWGKAKDVISIEGEARPVFRVVLQGDRLEDPLEVEAEAVDQPERKLPALPGPMAEIGFTLEDLEEPQP